MKRFRLLLAGFLVSLSVLPASAQQYYVGAVGGLNFADLATNIVDLETNPRTVLMAGVVFGQHLDKNVYIHLEPMYLQKGAHAADMDIDAKLSFLEVPLYFKVVFGKKTRSHLLGGPTFGLLLTSKAEGRLNGEKFKADLKEITKNVDFGLGLGAGVSVATGSGSVFLDTRYTFGLSNLNKGGTVEVKSGNEVTTEEIETIWDVSSRGFQITLGYTIPLSGE